MITVPPTIQLNGCAIFSFCMKKSNPKPAARYVTKTAVIYIKPTISILCLFLCIANNVVTNNTRTPIAQGFMLSINAVVNTTVHVGNNISVTIFSTSCYLCIILVVLLLFSYFYYHL